jgi:hypothetical protein
MQLRVVLQFNTFFNQIIKIRSSKLIKIIKRLLTKFIFIKLQLKNSG